MRNLYRLLLNYKLLALAPIEPTLRFVVALAIANLPFLWLEHSEFMSRAMINMDLALALCILPRLPIIGIAMLAIAWGADWIVNLAMAFHFSTPAEFVKSIHYAASLDYKGFIQWPEVIWTVTFIVVVTLLFFVTRRQHNMWQPGIAITFLLVFADAVNGSSLLSSRSALLYPVNLAGSPSITLVMSLIHTSASEQLLKLRKEDTVQGLVDIPAWAAANPDRGVLFVIVESLGVPTDSTMREWVQSQWLIPSLHQRFNVHTANIPFKGSTTSAELRSLCILAGSYRSVDSAQGVNCLPAQLAANGWSTIGMHGFSGRMFNRENWWPKVGLQTAIFGEAPEFQGERCGTVFRGGCDNTLLAIGVKALAPRRFVYLLTLNTHLPIDRPAQGTPIPTKCDSIESNSEVCDHISATTAVLRQLQQALETVTDAPLVVVIGDHAPPFSNKLSRQAFLQDKVPAAVLVPRY
jgi:hypothetical protein